MKSRILKASSVALCVIALVLMLAGCEKEKDDSQQGGFTFTDALSRSVTIEKKPERVAALIGSFADVWMLSGGTICATAEDAWEDFSLELDQAVNIGGAHSPSLELLLSAQPDFVIASASTSSNTEMRQSLEGAGITVAYFDVDCFEDYLSMLDICTDITGRKDLYKKNGLQIKEQIEEIKERCAEANLSEKEKTVLLLRASSGFVKAKGSEGTILGEMLADLGCINIADSDSTLLDSLGAESIIRTEPYRIFVVTMGDDTQKAIDNLDRLIKENAAWSSLDAVKNNRLHVMDRKLFNIKPNAEWAESYEQLGKILLEEK